MCNMAKNVWTLNIVITCGLYKGPILLSSKVKLYCTAVSLNPHKAYEVRNMLFYFDISSCMCVYTSVLVLILQLVIRLLSQQVKRLKLD
jgi:uncharacterized membrane protein YGL010W